MNEEKYIQDIRDIREMMSRSSRFISLSGYSGIAAGFIALCGAYFAYTLVYTKETSIGYNRIDPSAAGTLLMIAAVTLVASIVAGIFFTSRKTRKAGEKIWDHQTKRLLINLAIPLITGGIFCLLLLLRGYVGLIAPLTLIFYGLALVNASKYTLTEVRSLGLLEIALGLVASYFLGYGLFFWALGFGVLHIIYGIIMQMKYSS